MVETGADLGLDVRGRVALITGGSRGIGRATALCLAAAGAHVAVNYLRDAEAAREVVGLVEKSGVGGRAFRADVAWAAEAEALVRETVGAFGRLDLLVCNAGVWEGAGVEEISEELWDRTLETNLKGTWAVCRAAAPVLKRAGFGRVVIVSSTAGQRGEALFSNYAASKGGQLAFMKSLAAELAPHGVNVNAVAPGWVDTEMTKEALSDPAARAEAVREIPLGRLATAEEIALPVLFLCSAWARHLTGSVLSVNGGSVL